MSYIQLLLFRSVIHKIVNCLNFVGLYYYFALYLFTPRYQTSGSSSDRSYADVRDARMSRVAARAECRQESPGGKDCVGPPPAGHGVVEDNVGSNIKTTDN